MPNTSEINLAPLNFQDSALLKHLPKFQSIIYKGEIQPKIRNFEVSREGKTSTLIVQEIIRSEEGLIWTSCRTILERVAKMAAAQVRGFFEWNILSLELKEGLEHLNIEDFTSLLVNKARKLNPGEIEWIQYGKFLGFLKKRINENWGKIDLETAVEVFHKLPSQLDLLVKKLLKETESFPEKTLVIQDLSHAPLFRFGEEEQTERMRKFLEKYKATSSNILPDIYMVHNQRAIELFAQFELK